MISVTRNGAGTQRGKEVSLTQSQSKLGDVSQVLGDSLRQMPTVRCPSCGGERFVQLSSGWVECISDVIYGGAPPELTGLPHPIHHYGPCKHRFQPSVVLAAEAAQRERVEKETRERAESEAAEEARREQSIGIMSRSSDPATILEALRVREGMLPPDILKETWCRLLKNGAFTSSEEMLTFEGRGTFLGYFLSRGGYTTQWGKWVERKREPVYRAPGAGYELVPRQGEIQEYVHEGYDLWFDASGALWSDGRSTAPARLAVGGASRDLRRLVVKEGESPRLQRRKAQYLGWEIRVPEAQGAWPCKAESIEYTRALKSVLEHRSSQE
jgi:hypothetical protein